MHVAPPLHVPELLPLRHWGYWSTSDNRLSVTFAIMSTAQPSLHHGIMSVSFHSICFFVRVKGCDEPSLRFSHDSRLEDCRDLRQLD